MKGSHFLASTARAASYNMLLQIIIRLMTFMLNAVVLRYISRDLLGVVNVRLTLLYSTILFLTKEAFERACLSHRDAGSWRKIINLMWCTVPLGAVFSCVLGLVWSHWLQAPDPAVVAPYGVGVAAFALSACLEVLAEPLYVTAQVFLFIKLKVVALGLSQAVRVVVAVVLVVWAPRWGLMTFALAQLASSLCYVAAYYVYFTAHIRAASRGDQAVQGTDKADKARVPLTCLQDMLPRAVPGQAFFDPCLVKLTWSFFKQSLLKQLLTEGERYVMTFFNVLSFAEQGVFDIINNLGSMVARFIFLPIEENGYLFFSQMLDRGKPAAEQTEDSITLSSQVLGVCLKGVTLIGCIVVVFGYPNSTLALHIYGGTILSSGSGPMLLRWYCVYVLLLALNGVSEGFVFATMSQSQVDRYNQKMLAFSVLFLLASWLLTTQVGSVGFILANCVNMGLRITHSVWFIGHYFEGTRFRPLAEVMPSVPVVAALAASFLVMSVSERHLVVIGQLAKCSLHVAVTGTCLALVLATIYVTEKRFIGVIKTNVLHKPHAH